MLKLVIFGLAVLISASVSQDYAEYESYNLKDDYYKEPIWYRIPYKEEPHKRNEYNEVYESRRKTERYEPFIDLIKPDSRILRKSLSKLQRKLSSLKSGLLAILANDLKNLKNEANIQINRRYKPTDRSHYSSDEYRPLHSEYDQDMYHEA
ncbi:hypothetical protein BpHYR1_039172 [Brachionus plicatilis]|uniref:Seminal fluid protein n=1 Tax=Brachionus plicatilis TaxID=10195 RepID=A0A3M7QNC5_BRAPC|nr:hypothetical protein BpHYR1_039172 [Brachionus plicatilis]